MQKERKSANRIGKRCAKNKAMYSVFKDFLYKALL